MDSTPCLKINSWALLECYHYPLPLPLARKVTFLSLRNNQLDMNKGAYQHIGDNDGPSKTGWLIIITEHTERFANPGTLTPISAVVSPKSQKSGRP